MTIRTLFLNFAVWNKPVMPQTPADKRRSDGGRHYNILKMNKIKNNINNELQMELCVPHPGDDRGSQ